jgi:hypothetical protein
MLAGGGISVTVMPPETPLSVVALTLTVPPRAVGDRTPETRSMVATAGLSTAQSKSAPPISAPAASNARAVKVIVDVVGAVDPADDVTDTVRAVAPGPTGTMTTVGSVGAGGAPSARATTAPLPE